MSLPTYCCTQCKEPVGFFYASKGMLCEGCQSVATCVIEPKLRSTGQQLDIDELDRMMAL